MIQRKVLGKGVAKRDCRYSQGFYLCFPSLVYNHPRTAECRPADAKDGKLGEVVEKLDFLGFTLQSLYRRSGSLLFKINTFGKSVAEHMRFFLSNPRIVGPSPPQAKDQKLGENVGHRDLWGGLYLSKV